MMLTAVVALGATLTGFGETVTNVRGAQRPNSNLVDIYYDLNASDGGTYAVAVTLEGKTESVPKSSLTGDVGEGVSPGKNRHIVWDAGADWPDKKGDVKAVVTTTREAPKGKHDKVQLWEGGPYWATTNIGADNPWEYGLYFWWGDTVGHRPSGTTFDFDFGYYNSAVFTYNKTVSELQSAGWVTSDGVLAPAHDAAHVQWGGAWRMPTDAEFSALSHNCDWTWTTQSGVNGYVVRGRGAYASNSIFLPCANDAYGTSLRSGSYGDYWSSVVDPGGGDFAEWQYAYVFCFSSGSSHGTASMYRCFGLSVRPVQGFTK